MTNRHAAFFASLVGAAVTAVAAGASSTPVGNLPPGPTTTIAAHTGKTFTVRLPNPRVKGRVWRIARAFDGTVLTEVGEGATLKDVWVRFRALKAGSTQVVFAVTLGETAHAYGARTFKVVVGS